MGLASVSASSAAPLLPVMRYTVSQSHACCPFGPHAATCGSVAASTAVAGMAQVVTTSVTRWLTTRVEPPGGIDTP